MTSTTNDKFIRLNAAAIQLQRKLDLISISAAAAVRQIDIKRYPELKEVASSIVAIESELSTMTAGIQSYKILAVSLLGEDVTKEEARRLVGEAIKEVADMTARPKKEHSVPMDAMSDQTRARLTSSDNPSIIRDVDIIDSRAKNVMGVFEKYHLFDIVNRIALSTDKVSTTLNSLLFSPLRAIAATNEINPYRFLIDKIFKPDQQTGGVAFDGEYDTQAPKVFIAKPGLYGKKSISPGVNTYRHLIIESPRFIFKIEMASLTEDLPDNLDDSTQVELVSICPKFTNEFKNKTQAIWYDVSEISEKVATAAANELTQIIR